MVKSLQEILFWGAP